MDELYSLLERVNEIRASESESRDESLDVLIQIVTILIEREGYRDTIDREASER